MPIPPQTGKPAIREGIEAFISGGTSAEWIITNLAILGDIVFAERIDRARIDNQEVDLSLVRIFEVRDGNIRHLRDYFDLATYQEAFSTK